MTNLPGTTWEQWEDELTVPRLAALNDEWEKNTPTHMMVAWIAGFLGYKKPEKAKDITELFQLFPDGQIR